MPELRKDPVIDRWVIIATERARRPGNIIDRNGFSKGKEQQECIYCQGHDTENKISEHIRVIPFKDSLLEEQEQVDIKPNGIYQVIDGVGSHEVIVESDTHIANLADLPKEQIAAVIGVYAQRLQLLKDKKKFTYFVVYKNYGPSAGSRLMSHARSHVVALPIIPLKAKEKMQKASQYWQKNQRCIYCDLIKQELEDQKRVVMETENFVGIIPYAAKFLFEMHIYPKNHHDCFEQDIKGKEQELAGFIKILLQKMKHGLDDCAYNYVIHTVPSREGCQDHCFFDDLETSFHWHIEIMPRLTQMAGFEKGTGFYICSIPPEDMAAYIRGVEVNV